MMRFWAAGLVVVLGLGWGDVARAQAPAYHFGADWFAQRDADAVIQLFDRENVVAGLVYDIRDIFKDPHYAARENIVEVPDDDFGHVRMQGVVPRFLRTPGSVRRAGGRIGQDNDAIYRTELGLGDADLEQLRAQKVI